MKKILNSQADSLEHFLFDVSPPHFQEPQDLYDAVKNGKAIGYNLDGVGKITLTLFVDEVMKTATLPKKGTLEISEKGLALGSFEYGTGRFLYGHVIKLEPGLYEVNAYDEEDKNFQNQVENKTKKAVGNFIYRFDNIAGPILGFLLFTSIFILPAVWLIYFGLRWQTFGLIVGGLTIPISLIFLYGKSSISKKMTKTREKVETELEKKFPQTYIVLKKIGMKSKIKHQGVWFGPGI